MLRNRAANEDLDAEGRANVELRLKLIVAHARYRGWLVDRKQVSQVTARVNVARGDLEAAIRADIERLAPGSLKRIESGEADLKSIASGTVSERAHLRYAKRLELTPTFPARDPGVSRMLCGTAAAAGRPGPARAARARGAAGTRPPRPETPMPLFSK
jgi:hypothetical protein